MKINENKWDEMELMSWEVINARDEINEMDWNEMVGNKWIENKWKNVNSVDINEVEWFIDPSNLRISIGV